MTARGTSLPARPPIVAILGHVDHGKTTLLDTIRKANVASREAGGITQAVGAYEIVRNGRKITFIDTPGHEAFTKMRSRGANIADLAILVVAADEGVQPQTKESIKILEETKTPFIVAFTKIDKPGADIEKVKQELMQSQVFLEGLGGEVSYQAVSAKSGEHVDELLDLILLAADVMDLSYDPDAPASGFVLEARMDRRRGMEATVLVKNGTLRYGSPIATRSAQGKVKIFEDFTGKAVKELVPSAPAIVVGFEKLPQIGEEFSAGTLSELLGDVLQEKTGPREMPKDPSTLRLLLKADESGSLEALYGIVDAMKGTLPVAITGDAVGDITDGDVQFAVSTNSMILGFNTRVEKGAQALADVQKIKVVTSKIIYDLTRAIEETIKERSGPQALGILEVLAVFNQTRMDKQLVGGKVISGQLKPKMLCTVKRDNKEVGKGRIITIREGKKEVTIVEGGKEAGIVLGASILIEQGDHIVAA